MFTKNPHEKKRPEQDSLKVCAPADLIVIFKACKNSATQMSQNYTDLTPRVFFLLVYGNYNSQRRSLVIRHLVQRINGDRGVALGMTRYSSGKICSEESS